MTIIGAGVGFGQGKVGKVPTSLIGTLTPFIGEAQLRAAVVAHAQLGGDLAPFTGAVGLKATLTKGLELQGQLIPFTGGVQASQGAPAKLALTGSLAPFVGNADLTKTYRVNLGGDLAPFAGQAGLTKTYDLDLTGELAPVTGGAGLSKTYDIGLNGDLAPFTGEATLKNSLFNQGIVDEYDDLYAKWSATTFAKGASVLYVGSRTSADSDYVSSWRIPVNSNGKFFSELYLDLVLRKEDSSSAFDYEILVEQVDNAGAVVDQPSLVSRTYGTAVQGTLATGIAVPSTITTPNLASIANAVLNRPGFVSGNYLHFIMRDVVRNNPTVNRRQFAAVGNMELHTPAVFRGKLTSTPPVAQPNKTVFRVMSSSDDGSVRAGSTSLGLTDTNLYIGDVSSTNNDYQAFARLSRESGTPVPQGRGIQSARLFATQKAGRTSSFTIRYHLEASDNPTSPSVADLNPTTGRPQVGGVSYNTNAPWVTGQVYSVDVTGLVQAVLNRAGYVAGNPFMFRLDPEAFNGYGGENTVHQLHSFDSDPAKALWLEITW